MSILLFYQYFSGKVKIDYDIKKLIISFFIFYIYIISASFFAEHQTSALKSAVSQIRFFLFSLFIYFFINFNQKFFFNLIKFYQIILFLFSIDLIFQSIFGYNVLNFKPSVDNPNRYSGLFSAELVAGTFLFFLSIPVVSHIIGNFKNFYLNEKIYNFFFMIVISLAIIQTGDRMATLMYLSSIFLIFLLELSLKKFLGLFLVFFIFVVIIFNTFSNVQKRYTNLHNDLSDLKNFGYYRLFSSSINIWKENKFFGVGLKNYRKVCNTNVPDNHTNLPTLCSTHPHNSLLELLVETGLIGLILFKIFIISVINFIYQKKNLFREKNFFKPYSIGLLITLFFFIWPIKSSGSMFTTFYMSFVWFNLGLLLCLLKKNDKY
ncbi:MAG: O-antigen ligase family protein [Pelagibacteraceae bacterium]|nr:O-antigen ligase family protein [Pelagibacteraceae bacterium]